MKLRSETSELASLFQLNQAQGNAEVSGVQLSSGLCEPGDLFIAIAGASNHGIEFLQDAINRGATAVLVDPDHIPDTEIAVLTHPNPKVVAGKIAAHLYQTAKLRIQLFGVTGTNGKTSTTTYLQQLLEASGRSCGLSASTNRIVGDQVLSSALTTPEVTELHRMFSQMRDAGQKHAAIEVSAQALIRHRIDGVCFDVVGFTNLSRDHLDDFNDMESYLAAKAELFTPIYANRGVVLAEDDFAKKLIALSKIPIVSIGDDGDYRFAYADSTLTLGGKASAEFEFAGGALMAKNLVLAIVMLLESGVPIGELQSACQHADLRVPGRLERVSQAQPAIYVDYAHTPAGVAAAVNELRGKFQYLTVVLGASGNRDQGKREPMALAARDADLLVITDQHPRNEDPALIRATLVDAALSAMSQDSVMEIADPAQAIAKAVSATPKTGAVLWCGPGHLTYREIAGKKVPFDARAIAAELVSHD